VKIFESQEALWHCPTLFSIFHDADQLMEILTLIMHERSIIFVSNNLTILSNIILGFQVLIRPFIWYHPLIQILPSALLGILDSPFPMIVGITHEDYQELELSEQEKSLRTWVIISPGDTSHT
jgi:hypothetical protein